MSRLTSVLGFVCAVAIVAVGGWAIVRGVDRSPGVVGSFATALGAVVAVVVQRGREKRQELERSHREQMAPIYEQLVDKLKATNEGDTPGAEASDNVAFFKSLHTKLLLYGPTPVLREWVAWQRTGVPEDARDPSALLAYERVLLAIRTDLGHNNDGLKPGDLLRVYISDIDEGLTLWAEQATQSIEATAGRGEVDQRVPHPAPGQPHSRRRCQHSRRARRAAGPRGRWYRRCCCAGCACRRAVCGTRSITPRSTCAPTATVAARRSTCPASGKDGLWGFHLTGVE